MEIIKEKATKGSTLLGETKKVKTQCVAIRLLNGFLIFMY
jgi:hypothetical protein